jgi:DNA-binding Xre family transcriptional regulator
MRVALDVGALRREMALRALTGAELASIAGISEATVSHMVNAHRVEHGTVRKVCRALMLTPVVPGADAIIAMGVTAAPVLAGSDRNARDA